MSDPAVEAAQRAWDTFLQTRVKHLTAERSMDISIDAAREALNPIRELHRRVDDGHPSGLPTCEHCRGDWPCSTAALVYSTEELKACVARRPKVTE